MILKTKKINSLSKLPEQAHKGDMFDLFANEDIVLNSFESKIVKLGLAFDIPKGYRIKIFSRSSLPIKKQVIVSNGTGIIDTCLDKDTKITLINGEEDTIENITKRVDNGEKLYAISINEKDGSYAAGLIEKGINNGFKDVYRYYFDKGGYIDCTENHKVRLNRKREYKEIGKIKNTNSLTPLNLKNDKDGYLIATSWKKDKKYFSVRLHRDIYVNHYNTDYPQVVHHKDENVKNNNPENLQGDVDNIKRNAVNHKIIKSEYLGKKEVYDLCIKDYHNFFANGICVHNCYKNEVGLICHTLPKNFFGFLINNKVEIKRGDKIAQMQLEKIKDFQIEEVEELDMKNDRGGGFGSTDKVK